MGTGPIIQIIPHPSGLAQPLHQPGINTLCFKVVFKEHGTGEFLLWGHLGPWEKGAAGPQASLSRGTY